MSEICLLTHFLGERPIGSGGGGAGTKRYSSQRQRPTETSQSVQQAQPAGNMDAPAKTAGPPFYPPRKSSSNFIYDFVGVLGISAIQSDCRALPRIDLEH